MDAHVQWKWILRTLVCLWFVNGVCLGQQDDTVQHTSNPLRAIQTHVGSDALRYPETRPIPDSHYPVPVSARQANTSSPGPSTTVNETSESIEIARQTQPLGDRWSTSLEARQEQGPALRRVSHLSNDAKGGDVATAAEVKGPNPSETNEAHHAMGGIATVGDHADVSAEADVPIDSGELDVAAIQLLIAAAKESTELAPEQLGEVTALLQQAMEWLKATDDLQKRQRIAMQEIELAPERKHALELALSQPAEPNVLLEDAAIEELERILQDSERQLEAARQRRDSNRVRTEQFHEAKQKRSTQLQDDQKKLVELTESHNAEVPPTSIAAHTEAWQAEHRARKKLLEARIRWHEIEAKQGEAWMSTQSLQSDIDLRDVARWESQYKDVTKAITNRRQLESRRQAARARDEARLADPELRHLAQENASLAERRSEYADWIRNVAKELDDISQKLQQQQLELSDIKRKAEEVGFTETIGMLLRSQRHHLIDKRPVQRRTDEIAILLPKLQFEFMQLDESRKAMYDLPALTEEHMKHVDPSLLQRFTRDEATALVREQLEARKEYLDGVLADMKDYVDKLGELHVASKNCIEVTDEHRNYIDQHVLWIRSADRLSFRDVSEARRGIVKLLDHTQWMDVVRSVGRLIRNQLIPSAGVVIALGLALTLLDRLRDRIRVIGESKEMRAAFRFLPTVEAILETAIVAWLFPVLVYLAGWCLARSQTPSDLALALSEGLRWVALVWCALSFLYQLSVKSGVGESHFGWHCNNLAVLRKNLRWLMSIGLPVVFCVMVIETYQNGAFENSLGRLAFIVGMTIMAWFMHRLLYPYKGAKGIWANQKVWMYRARFALHAVAVLIPCSLSVLSTVGYVYSAHQLAYRAQLTLWLVLTVTIAHAFVTRYLTIVRKRTAMRHMQRRRSEQAQRDGEPEPSVVIEEQQLDFDAIGDQLQRLLRGCVGISLVVGASLVWADMIPALAILDGCELWTITQSVTKHETLPNGDLKTFSVPIDTVITLADGLLAVFAIIATVVATRNLPGLLNITVFERLPIDFGARYALTTVTRYLIAMIGFVAAFHLIGITWGSVQWLVAAMTVGLGFGLQEIFANFVSGLIILSERPVRVGDMITVGGVTGKVTRMQIRATTITDFDRRELVVPNKRFITEDVINWTLSDPITRVVLSVGIAYHCDPQLAREKLLDVAVRHPLVLTDPPPSAIFMGFGDSTLDLELRVFIIGRDNLAEVRDQLNLAINKSFRNANLEIAFPQRDLHIRSIDAKVIGEMLHPRKAA